MREMIMLFYLKREKEINRESGREDFIKKNVSQQVVRLQFDEGKDNIAGLMSH